MPDVLMRYARFDTELSPFIYNWRPGGVGNLSKWSIAKSKMVASGYRPQMLCIGDSKTMGAGAGTTDTGTGGTTFTAGAAVKSKTKFLADRLNAIGIPVSRQTTVGHQGLTNVAQLKAYDTRITGLTNWTFDSGNPTVGGFPLINVSPNTDAYSFSPEGTVDRVDVWYYRGTSAGTFTISDGASVVSTVDSSGGLALIKATATLTRGSGKTININRTTANANQIFIASVRAYDSQTPAIDLVNAGWSGSTTANWIVTGAPWSPLTAIGTYAPDLTTIALGANDIRTGVSVTTYTNNLRTIANRGLLSGSVLLIFPAMGQQGATWGDAATQAAYEAAAYALADELDLPLLNENAIFGGYTLGNTQGKFADLIHENAIGNGELMSFYATLLGV